MPDSGRSSGAGCLVALAGTIVGQLLAFLLVFLKGAIFGASTTNFVSSSPTAYGAQGGNSSILFPSALVGAIYLIWSAYVTARTMIIRVLGRQMPKTALQNKLALWNLMHDAYRALVGPVVDPTRVKRALEAAADKGAVWEGADYAILNRVIARDPVAWVTDDSHAYRRREASDISPAPEL